jgi:hypothetical protein
MGPGIDLDLEEDRGAGSRPCLGGVEGMPAVVALAPKPLAPRQVEVEPFLPPPATHNRGDGIVSSPWEGEKERLLYRQVGPGWKGA